MKDNIWHLHSLSVDENQTEVRCNKFECQKDIHFETKPEQVATNR